MWMVYLGPSRHGAYISVHVLKRNVLTVSSNTRRPFVPFYSSSPGGTCGTPRHARPSIDASNNDEGGLTAPGTPRGLRVRPSGSILS